MFAGYPIGCHASGMYRMTDESGSDDKGPLRTLRRRERHAYARSRAQSDKNAASSPLNVASAAPLRPLSPTVAQRRRCLPSWPAQIDLTT